METRLPNLVWLRSFEAAARLLNFTETGRELGLTQTAVSLHIKALEGTLGCQLFERKPRHLELTAMGQAYVHSVRKALGDINLATTSLFGPISKQTITVRAPISTSSLFLAPKLPDFMKANPGINIRLVSTIWADSASDEEIDVDLRLGYGDWPGMQVEKISSETIVPICASRLRDSINKPEDLLKAPLIHILGHEDNWARYFEANGIKPDSSNKRYQVDTTVAALALAQTGAGHATIFTRFANNAIRQGIPVSIAGEPIPFAHSHFLTNPVAHAPARPEVAIFKTWLKEIFENNQVY